MKKNIYITHKAKHAKVRRRRTSKEVHVDKYWKSYKHTNRLQQEITRIETMYLNGVLSKLEVIKLLHSEIRTSLGLKVQSLYKIKKLSDFVKSINAKNKVSYINDLNYYIINSIENGTSSIEKLHANFRLQQMINLRT